MEGVEGVETFWVLVDFLSFSPVEGVESFGILVPVLNFSQILSGPFLQGEEKRFGSKRFPSPSTHSQKLSKVREMENPKKKQGK